MTKTGERIEAGFSTALALLVLAFAGLWVYFFGWQFILIAAALVAGGLAFVLLAWTIGFLIERMK